MVRTIGQRRIVSARCERAAASGVRVGMTLADARSAFPPDRVHAVPCDTVRDAAALSGLARWAHRFSPRVAIDPPDALLIDLTGCARSLGGEAAIRENALASLGRLNIGVRCVIAPTYAGAGALARHTEASIIEPSALRPAIEALPVRALGLDPKAEAGLDEVGIDRIGQLIDMPRSVLPARFGHDLLLRLDRMLGRAMETIEPVRPEDPVRAGVDFDGPTHRWESIEHVVRTLLADLCEQLAGKDLGVLRLVLTLRRSDLPPAVLAFVASRPTHDAKHLWSLIRPRLERTHLGFGVEGMDLLAERHGRIAHTQTSAWAADEENGDDPEAFARLVDTLSNRLGRDRVLRAEPVDSHRPERAVVHRPATDSPGPAAPSDEAHPPPRPTRLLSRPEPAEVLALTPDGPVRRLAWDGPARDAVTCLGPERIGPEWWRVARDHARTRDYFAIQEDTGRWVWLFRELETGRWFVHGIWS